jgi:lycopene beta-cyclase
VRLEEVLHVERVHIPLGAGRAEADRDLPVRWAAGGLVHPATGYSLATSLRGAPVVARAIREAMARRAIPADVAAAAARALWPVARRRARLLEQVGLEALVNLDRAEVQAFFDAFFDLPPPLWQAYLSGTLPPARVVELMRQLFGAVPLRVKARLLAVDPMPLARALTGWG